MTTTSSVSSSTSSTASTTSTTSSSSSSQSAQALGASIVNSMGLGTGIDMTNLATEIASASYASQLSNVNSQLSSVQLQISQAGQLKSDILTLASSVSSAIDSGNLLPAPTVSNSSVASASLPLGSTGSTSGYSLEVTQLAQPQVLASSTLSNSATLEGGTLTFNFGTITTTGSGSSATSTFTQDTSKTAGTVTIPAGASLAQVAGAINGANIGVTAYVATNANGQQLVIKGAQGADSAFTISASGSGAASGQTALSSLAYDPAASSNSTSLVQSSTDAAFKLDGIARTSSSNTVDYAAPGLSLKLTGTNAGSPTTITYSDPSSGITTTMQNLVSALNSMRTEINTDTAVGSGALVNDSATQALSRQLAALPGTTIMPNAASGAPSTLADLGVSVDKDGNFSLDSSKLSAALQANQTAVAAMFTNGLYGIYGTIENMALAASSSTDAGSLTGSVQRYTAIQTNLQTQQTNFQTQQTNLQNQLIQQYSSSNATVASYKSIQTFLTAQIDAWNGTSSNSNK